MNWLELQQTPIGGMTAIVALGIAGYWWWQYEGLYQLLAELQLAVFGGYEVTLTVGATFLICFWIGICALWLLARLQLADPARPITRGSLPWYWDWLNNWCRQNSALLGLYLIAVTVLASGGLMLHDVRANRHRVQMEVGELESGTEVKSRLVAITGVPLSDQAVLMRDHGSRAYVPLVSASWVQGQPVSALLNIRQHEFEAQFLTGAPMPGASAFRGMIQRTGAPGLVRVELNRAGFDVTDAKVIEVGRQPSDHEQFAWMLMLAGGTALLIAVAWSAWSLARSRESRSSVRG